jgi:calcyclin binding protein
MEGIDEKSDHTLKVEEQSFEFSLRLPTGNYKLSIPKLYGKVDPKSSKLSFKKKSINIEMKKSDKKHWSDLIFKEEKMPKTDPKKDPQEGLMDLMKKMYDEGTPEMKMQISKAMYESRYGKKDDKKDEK